MTNDVTIEAEALPEVKTRAELAIEALDYRRQGHGYEAIGQQMGISPQEAFALVNLAIQSLPIDTPARSRMLDLHRLDQMMASIYDTAASGDLQACHEVRQLIRLRGLIETPYRNPSPQHSRAIDLFKDDIGDLFR